ncbi:MAG: GyrI-like domain-containing protein [Clostridia bacterium]|jgi:predicted transcriptional regulator YdeE
MKTELVHLNSLLLGGVNFYGDPFSKKGGWDTENEIGKTWIRFTDYITKNPERSYSCKKYLFYEILIYGKETPDKGYLEVFVGEQINTAEVPLVLSTKFFPESDYIKVTLSGQEITSDWWQTVSAMSEYSNIEKDTSFIIQTYDERFKGMDCLDDSVMDAYIPIKA